MKRKRPARPLPADSIPAHTKCENCGDCCGLIPCSGAEFDKIIAYLDGHPSSRDVAIKNGHQIDHCPFRDDENRRCAIYPVRPVICRLFGVAYGLDCKCGNSAHVNGDIYLGAEHSLDNMVVLNFRDYSSA